MINLSEGIGKRIRIYREGQKMSRDTLAERASLHPTYVGQLERGEKNPTIETLHRISVALNVPIDYLICFPLRVRKGSAFSKCITLLENQTQKDHQYLYEILSAFVEFQNP